MLEMESPFFRNRRWYQQPDPTHYPASSRGVPVYQVDPIHEPHRPVHRPEERSSGPKVVRIPVHFVGFEQVDRAGSAVKIQKVFRGFLVRKCLKKVKDIRVQVDEIKEKLWKSEVVELVRREERERLRMNEALMSLLFKLDSICGVDLGVRACRKSVIRKVIALQERIDAIVAAGSEGNCENDDQVTEIVERDNSIESESDRPTGSSENSGKSMEVDGDECNGENHDLVAEDKNGRVRNGELLARMMEESKKMNERNEMQMKMLNALAHRVEMLEKAFVCDRLGKKKEKKKKKRRAKASATCKENY